MIRISNGLICNSFACFNSYRFCQLYLFIIQLIFKLILKMRPSPFAGKLKKRQIKLQKDKPEQKQQDALQQPSRYTQNPSNNLKPPSSNIMLKLSRDKEKEKSRQKSKQVKNDHEAVRDEQQGQKMQSKASASFKPNLKLKGGKKIKLSTNQVPAQLRKQEESMQQPPRQIHRPNIFKKGGDNLGSERNINRQEVVVEEEQKQVNEEDSYEGSGSVGQSISIAPKFKIKGKQQHHFPVIQQQPMQQTGFGVTNFADMKIQTRQINIDASEIKVSQVKIQKQKARVNQLSKLLNLQIDLFQQTLNISCVTPYQIYINKIKSGSLINSNDQAFDQKSSSGCQTLTLQFEDFMNQCPQDYHTDAMNIVQRDQTEAFNKFINRVAPVLQQLIKPSTTVVMPPIFLLALRPQFKKLIACPFPVFVYHSSPLSLGIIVIGQKLFVCQNEIQTVLSLSNYLVAGAKDGTIYLWTGKNDKSSKLYRKIHQFTQSTNFQLPQYSTQQLDRFSVYRTENSIVSLLFESNDQFCSLDSSCKLIKWRVERGRHNSAKLHPEISYQFLNMIQRSNLLGYGVKKRNETYFISSSAGILVWNGEEIIQRLDSQGFRVVNMALPHRTNFVYAACQDSSIRIYEQHYANQLFKIYLPASVSITDLWVPQTQYQNKKLSLSSNIYIICSQGSIYRLNLLKNSTETKLLAGGPDKKDRDIIYRGINKLNDGFEMVNLWKDLKCTSEVKKIDINVQPTVNNIKTILQQNRQLHNWLESEHSLTIVE